MCERRICHVGTSVSILSMENRWGPHWMCTVAGKTILSWIHSQVKVPRQNKRDLTGNKFVGHNYIVLKVLRLGSLLCAYTVRQESTQSFPIMEGLNGFYYLLLHHTYTITLSLLILSYYHYQYIIIFYLFPITSCLCP